MGWLQWIVVATATDITLKMARREGRLNGSNAQMKQGSFLQDEADSPQLPPREKSVWRKP